MWAIVEFPDEAGQMQALSFTGCLEEIVATRIEDVPAVIRRVSGAAAAGEYAVGYVAYEAAPAFDPAFRVQGQPAVPLAWFGVFNGPSPTAPPQPAGSFSVSAWQPEVDRSNYHACIADARRALGQGLSYQVNYTYRMRASFGGDDLAFYHQLTAAQGHGYFAYLSLGRYRVLSASPELFFRQQDRTLITRPMKGTALRGRWLEEDEAHARWLSESAKNQAENVTIVDLLRNDMSQVAEPGSVRVPELFTVERYPTVWQMTSTVACRIRQGNALADIFAALFPCGSVTGAPKISTMSLIARLEASPRQVYCGAVGLVTPESATFNVAIRTVLIDSQTGQAEYGVGGGITWDSEPGDEYEEALAKARVLVRRRPDFDLLETLRLEDGQYWMEDRHLTRLERSARYFDIPFSTSTARDALAQLSTQHPAGLYRVRLLVSQTGWARAECFPYVACSGLQPAAIAHSPVDSADPFLFHKTTHREIYERRRGEMGSRFDVLLWNEREEATEFATGNLVVEVAGQRYTPPIECGLLPGVFREELLATGAVRERAFKLVEVRSAERVWHINSLRAWTKVRLEA